MANENFPPNVIKQLAKELKSLDETPPEGIKVVINDDDFSTIFADIEGPSETPYENGVFRMKLILSHDFPQTPPQGYFMTKIFHPNIATNGAICVDALQKEWDPSLGLRHVLVVVRCLLVVPFPDSALNEQAAAMLRDNYEEYARLARLYTGIHALRQKPKSKTGAISESTTALNVDQSKPSTIIIDHHTNKVASATVLLPSPLASAAPSKGGINSQDQPAVATEVTVAPGTTALPAQKAVGVVATKILAEKKKMDARKKSLKRL